MRCSFGQISMGGGVWVSEGEEGEKKIKRRAVGSDVWTGGGLGKIAVTLSGRIFFFFLFAEKVSGGGQWVTASGQVVFYLVT
jgi:hypothetical protein